MTNEELLVQINAALAEQRAIEPTPQNAQTNRNVLALWEKYKKLGPLAPQVPHNPPSKP